MVHPIAGDGATLALSHGAPSLVREIKQRGHQHYLVETNLEGTHNLHLEDGG